MVLRSLVWVCWEQSYFDSDQAITGLMAKHLAELRAFPLLFYGQHYMLAVEAWLAAPVIGVFGASVAALKLPLVVLNVAIALLLVKILVDEVGLAPLSALAASLFFVLPPPIAASRLVEAQGGNVEPFLYTLLLWMTRRRPVVFGLIAGIGFMHRELTAYAVTAILMVELWQGRLFSTRNLRDKSIVFTVIVAVALVVRGLEGHADLLGPGTGGTKPTDVLSGQLGFWAARVCWNTATIIPNLRWLLSDNLSVLFGWHVAPFSEYFLSQIVGGHRWALAGLAGLFIVAALAWLRRRRSPGPLAAAAAAGHDGLAFPAYLVLVGIQAIGVYALFSCLVQDRMLIRYTLLALFIPIGTLAWLLRLEGSRRLKAVAVAGTLLWASASATDTTRVLVEYIRHPPVNQYRELADFLEREGIKYAKGPYWTAYAIDFLTNERVTVASYQKVRINEYETIVERHINESATIYFDDPCRPDEDGINLRRWCVGYLTRARHARDGR